MTESNSYRLEPYGLDGIRSDGFLYIDTINNSEDPIAKRGAWFLEKFAKEVGLESPETLVNRLNNPSPSDIVVTSRLVEPTVHSGMNWRSKKELGGAIKTLDRYVGFGFGSKSGEVNPVQTIIVDPAFTVVQALIREAMRTVILDEADEHPGLSHIELSSAIRLKSIQKSQRQ